MKSDSICLVWYSGSRKISSFDAFDHEYNFEVATKEVAYTMHHVGHQGNGVGQKGHVLCNHFHPHHPYHWENQEDVQEGDHYLYQY